MTRALLIACGVVAAAMMGHPAGARAQPTSPLGGVWTLNRPLSEFPREIGFNPSWMTSSTGSGDNPAAPERRRTGTSRVGRRWRRPWVCRSVLGPARKLRGRAARAAADRRSAQSSRAPDGGRYAGSRHDHERARPVADVSSGRQGRDRSRSRACSFAVTTMRDGDQLVVLYHVEQNRELRYTFSHSANPSQLIVDVQFLEQGAGDKAQARVRRRLAECATRLRRPGRIRPTPPAPARSPESFDQRPDAELIGLKNLGIVVEDLSAAGGCVRSESRQHRERVVEAADGRRLHGSPQFRRGHLRVRQRDDEQPVRRHVRLALRRVSLHPGDRQAVVPRSAGAGAGVADASRRHRHQRARAHAAAVVAASRITSICSSRRFTTRTNRGSPPRVLRASGLADPGRVHQSDHQPTMRRSSRCQAGASSALRTMSAIRPARGAEQQHARRASIDGERSRAATAAAPTARRRSRRS